MAGQNRQTRAAAQVQQADVDDDDDDDDEAEDEGVPAVGPAPAVAVGGAIGGVVGAPLNVGRKRRVRSFQDVMQDFDDASLVLRRALAGYNSLKTSFDQFNNVELSDEQRLGRLPLLRMSASATGRDANEVVIDTKKVNPQYIAHVMVPLIGALQTEVTQALDDLKERLAELIALHTASVVPNG